MITKVKLSEGGEIEIPMEVINELGWALNDEVQIEVAMTGDHIIIHKVHRVRV